MRAGRLLAVACAVAAVAVVGSAWATAAGPPAPLTGRIVLVGARAEHHRQGVYPGAVETWRYALASSRRRGRPFGYMVLACVRIGTGTSLDQCTGTFSLPRGRVSVGGSILYPQAYELSVVGGTEAYVGVVGVAGVQQVSPRSSSVWFTITLG